MTEAVGGPADLAADVAMEQRWLRWQKRGVEGDRWRATVTGLTMVAALVAASVWFATQVL